MPQRLLLEGPDIDELLARVRVEHGPDARIVHAEQRLVGGVAGFFARRRFEVAVAVEEQAPTREAAVPASIDDLLALADAQDGNESAPARESSAPTPAAGRTISTQNPSFDHFVRDLISAAEGGPLHAQPDVGFVPASVRLEQPPAVRPDARLQLLDTLAAAAVSPPRQLIGRQMVVGPRGKARAVAKAWLAQCGEDGDALVDATDLEAVERSAPAQRGRLAVLETRGGLAGARRAARRLAELTASDGTAVTAVVDARWDVGTARAWLAALSAHGATVDQIAAHGLDDAADPLRLLELGPPVTWLDARPATLGTWARPCLDRL